MKRGTLIAIEGIDGAGKSTQAGLLCRALRAAGNDVALTREPTTGPFGREIRALSTRDAAPPPEAELALFVDDRRQHVREVVAPALAAGAVVVSDRYFLSSVAYQGARGLPPERILAESEAEFPIPDLVLLIALPPELGLRRVGQRGEQRNQAFERADFLNRAAKIFDALDRDYIERISGDSGPDSVAQRIAQVVQRRLPQLWPAD